jgi:membrane-associated phospholipid phosphatase
MALLSKVISVVFQPLFLPIYAFLLYVTIDHHSTFLIRSEQASLQFNYILSIQILLAVIIPIGSLYVMYRSNIITSMSIPDRKERIPIFIITLFYYLLTYYFLRKIHVTNLELLGAFMSFLTGGIILTGLSLIITFSWKISIHAIGISGLAGAFLGFSELLFPVQNEEEITIINILLLILVGVVCSARLHLKAHSFLQIIAGITLGFGVEYIVVSKDFWF